MATRSAIGMIIDGKVRAVYCHWDGYPEHNGRILVDHYQDPAKIQELISMGEISSLGPEIGEQHNFDWSRTDPKLYEEKCNTYTTFYHRDRGESLSIKEFNNIDQFVDYFKGSGCEYFYLWEQELGWVVKGAYAALYWSGVNDVLDKQIA